VGAHPESLGLFCLYLPADAGNPAVMAPRFRPVALRLRLSAGLLKQLLSKYAEEDESKQAREIPNEE
jgi:hypothetical protein